MRWIAPVFLCLAPQAADACTFCSGRLADKPTLRERYEKAKYVAWGEFDLRWGPPLNDPNYGVFVPREVAKAGSLLDGYSAIAAPRDILPFPKPGHVPTSYLVFGGGDLAPLEPSKSEAATDAVLIYVRRLRTQPLTDPTPRLAVAFEHLSDPDPTLSADGFLEFAKASDAEVTAARGVLKPGPLRQFLADPNTPADRVAVYALLLGLCGTADDAKSLEAQLRARPLAPRVADALGGYLTALVLLNPDAGWKLLGDLLTDTTQPYSERLAALSTARYFQATQPGSARPALTAAYRRLLAQPDLADVAVEDLRRFGWFDQTGEVLRVAALPTHSGRLLRRAFFRYALAAPGPDAAAYAAGVRKADPKLAASVEELLRVDGGR